MYRALMLGALLCWTCGISAADEKPAKDQVQEQVKTGDATEKYLAHPDDATMFREFVNEKVIEVIRLENTDPAAAKEKLAALKKVVDSVKPETERGKSQLSMLQRTLDQSAERIELALVPLADMEKKLNDNPHDLQSLEQYVRKVMLNVMPIVRTEPDEAEKQVAAALARIEKAREGADDAGKKQLELLEAGIKRYETAIAAGKKMKELIGKEAAPLEVEAWVNGTPLTDDDLKGKVVLLDFWAVWCGPCIATFPHLREWHEKYSDKGLVIIGLTRYYGFDWDEDAKQARRSATGSVAPEAEQEMLKKFAEHHNLHHRFAVQSEKSTTSEFYGVTGIPHVVVIDQQGKIRLMRVGSGEANAKAIGDMLEQLLASPTAASGG